MYIINFIGFSIIKMNNYNYTVSPFFLIQSGLTPLLIASRGGHEVIVELLLNSGADYSCTNKVIIIYSLSHVIFYYNTIVLITFN